MVAVRFASRLRLAMLAVAVPAFVLGSPHTATASGSAVAGSYAQTNLVSDLPGVAAVTDPHLVNPWGMAAAGSSPIWVNDNGSGVATLYDGQGVPFPPKPSAALVVRIPAPKGAGMGATSAPTGQVFNGGSGFVVSHGTSSGSSLFIFATEDGTIAGWSPSVDLHHAFIKVDRSALVDPAGDVGAVYKGLALASTSSGSFLYATNFRFGQVEVFDSSFNLVSAFTDPRVPTGYAPFGIHNIGGDLYVTFALQDSLKHDDLGGAGHGFVDIFSPSGVLLQRFASHGRLNSPWAVTLAPSTFGAFAGDILVGNFGDGRINAYDPGTRQWLGRLQNSAGQPIQIPGLWDLMFGNGSNNASTNSLYFTAGVNGEADGLFGDLNPNS